MSFLAVHFPDSFKSLLYSDALHCFDSLLLPNKIFVKSILQSVIECEFKADIPQSVTSYLILN